MGTCNLGLINCSRCKTGIYDTFEEMVMAAAKSTEKAGLKVYVVLDTSEYDEDQVLGVSLTKEGAEKIARRAAASEIEDNGETSAGFSKFSLSQDTDPDNLVIIEVAVE